MRDPIGLCGLTTACCGMLLNRGFFFIWSESPCRTKSNVSPRFDCRIAVYGFIHDMTTNKVLAETPVLPSAVPIPFGLRSAPIVSDDQGADGMDPSPLWKLSGWEKVRFRTQIGDFAMENPGNTINYVFRASVGHRVLSLPVAVWVCVWVCPCSYVSTPSLPPPD